MCSKTKETVFLCLQSLITWSLCGFLDPITVSVSACPLWPTGATSGKSYLTARHTESEAHWGRHVDETDWCCWCFLRCSTRTPPPLLLPPPPPPLHSVLRSGRRQLSQSVSQSVRWRLRKVSHFRDTAPTALVNMSSAHPEDTAGSVSPHLSARSNRFDWWPVWLVSGTRTGACGKATQLQCEYIYYLFIYLFSRILQKDWGEVRTLW